MVTLLSAGSLASSQQGCWHPFNFLFPCACFSDARTGLSICALPVFEQLRTHSTHKSISPILWKQSFRFPLQEDERFRNHDIRQDGINTRGGLHRQQRQSAPLTESLPMLKRKLEISQKIKRVMGIFRQNTLAFLRNIDPSQKPICLLLLYHT